MSTGPGGKSGTVRQIAELCRAGGLRVLAKTTGDRAEYILPDGSTDPVLRIGPARIREQGVALCKASSLRTDVLIVEGMALQPETLWVSEKILRASHVVIVNSRPDHAETMGAGRDGVLQTLRQMLPEAGKLFTTDEEGADFLRTEADRAGICCSVCSAPATDQARVLSRVVAEAIPGIGVLPGVDSSLPPKLSLPLVKISYRGMPVEIYDALSVNDVLSARLAMQSCPAVGDVFRVAMLVTRADRPLRTRDFFDWLRADPGFDALVVMGDHAGYALLRGMTSRFRKRLLPVFPWRSPEALLHALTGRAETGGRKLLSVFAFGNVHGHGETWRRELQRLARLEGRRHVD